MGATCTNLSEVLTHTVTAHPYPFCFLLCLIFSVLGVVLFRQLAYVKIFNERNLSDRMAIAREILEHNKQLGIPMTVELSWKRFLIVPVPIQKKKDKT